jgi:hypothetical protein
VPLYIAAGICVLNVLYISTVLPESLTPELRSQANTKLQDANAIGSVDITWVSGHPVDHC